MGGNSPFQSVEDDKLAISMPLTHNSVMCLCPYYTSFLYRFKPACCFITYYHSESYKFTQNHYDSCGMQENGMWDRRRATWREK